MPSLGIYTLQEIFFSDVPILLYIVLYLSSASIKYYWRSCTIMPKFIDHVIMALTTMYVESIIRSN